MYPSADPVIGQTVSHYRVTAELGAGGMGVVYLAEDLRLGRHVAIKFLPDGAAANPQALDRFRREARAASALNHRHICTIHEIDDHDGRPFIVMEALEGETLHSRIARKRFDLDGLLAVTMQVAEGLEAAHAKGIVHRDIKPSNIFITSSGDVKVLDFGLAKLAADGVEAAPAEAGPTMTSPGVFVTGPGQTLGTVAYMSPEQVRGVELDARTDIFSCGVVMYEMATAGLPFQGPTAGVIFDGILNKTPVPASKLNPAMPAALDGILDKALEKDRDLRYQSARDLRADLARLRRDSSAATSRASGPVPDTARPHSRRRPLLVMTTALAVVALAAAGYFAYIARRAVPPPQSGSPRALSRVTFDDGLQSQPTWSPDGRYIAYTSDKSGNFDIWVQAVAGGRAVQVTNNPATDWQPSWSADGNTLAFRSERDGGGIYAVPALGGAEKQLATFGFLPQWSPKKPELMFVVRPQLQNASLVVPPVYLVGLDGKPPRRILEESLGTFRAIEEIVWHPDGERISFSGRLAPSEGGFFTLPIAGGAPVRSSSTDSVDRTIREAMVGFGRYQWAPGGNALYFAGRAKGIMSVWRIGIDPSTLAFVSGPERLTTGAGHDVEIKPSPDGSKVAFVTKTETLRLWSLPFDAASGRTKGPAEAITGPTLLGGFDLSSDGRWLAFVVARPGKDAIELWSRDMDAGTNAMLAESRHYFAPRLSRDGAFVAYRTVLDTAPDRRLAWMKRGVSAQTTMPLGFANAWDWSEDGARILHSCPTPTKTPGLCSSARDISAAGATQPVVSDAGYAIYQGRFSPDDRWVLFNAQSLKVVGTSVLGLVPTTVGKWAPLTDAALWADKPRWAPDGLTIYFFSNRNGQFFDVWGLRFDPATGRAVGDPFRVTHTDSPGRTIDMSAGSELGVSATRLVVPMIEATGSIWMLDGVLR